VRRRQVQRDPAHPRIGSVVVRHLRPLPVQAQFSPVYAIASADVNKDGNPDLLLGGNFEKTRVSIGKIDANHGMLFLGDGKGNFKYIPQTESGFAVKGDVRDIQILKIKN